MLARIYKPAKTAMQSGKAKTKDWVLDFEQATPRVPDHLIGWPSTDDTQAGVSLRFETQEEAVAYAKAQGIPFQVFPEREPRRLIKAYADNFAFQRKEPWTH